MRCRRRRVVSWWLWGCSARGLRRIYFVHVPGYRTDKRRVKEIHAHSRHSESVDESVRSAVQDATATHLCLEKSHDVLQFHVRVDFDHERLTKVSHECKLHTRRCASCTLAGPELRAGKTRGVAVQRETRARLFRSPSFWESNLGLQTDVTRRGHTLACSLFVLHDKACAYRRGLG